MKLDREVGRVVLSGRRVSSRFFTVAWLPELHGAQSSMEQKRAHARLAIRVPKAAGDAVVRNRIRRLIREVFRLGRQNFTSNADIVIMVKPVEGGKSTNYSSIRENLVLLFRKTGLWG